MSVIWKNGCIKIDEVVTTVYINKIINVCIKVNYLVECIDYKQCHHNSEQQSEREKRLILRTTKLIFFLVPISHYVPDQYIFCLSSSY